VEDLVLSGNLFSISRSSSPIRTPSPDAGWHDDELNSDNECEKDRPYQHKQPFNYLMHESVGMAPGRTGVKGVIRDRNEALNTAREKRKLELAELNKRMEKANLSGKTFLEEEREREIEKLMMERSSGRVEEKMDLFGRNKGTRFGHLREVGLEGFLDAVEQEEKSVWVIVHLYEPSVDRCYNLDETLSKLARIYPDTKFLRSRAAALGFTSTSTPTRSHVLNRSRNIRQRSCRNADDADDPYEDGKYDESDQDSEHIEYDEDSVDTDMLPTMLVYHGGELVYNWVRVDWEAGLAGVEELLMKHHILHPLESNIFLLEDEDNLPE